MSRHERRYQKYLDRHRQKQANSTAGPGLPRPTAPQMAEAALAPIHQSLVPAKLFEMGLGHMVFSRSLPDGRVAVGAFLLDIFCLGVKDAFCAIIARDEYARRLSGWRTTENLQPMQAASFRKLLEGGVAYAHELGFNPHADYALASQIFGDVQATDCTTHFEYGHDGKPFYISGPHETEAQVRAILDHLDRRLGAGRFDYLVVAQ